MYWPCSTRSWAKLLKQLWEPTLRGWQRKWRGSGTTALCPWHSRLGIPSCGIPPKIWLPEVGRAWQFRMPPALWRVWCCVGCSIFTPQRTSGPAGLSVWYLLSMWFCSSLFLLPHSSDSEITEGPLQSQPPSRCASCWHRITEWFGRDFKDHVAPIPPPWAGNLPPGFSSSVHSC